MKPWPDALDSSFDSEFGLWAQRRKFCHRNCSGSGGSNLSSNIRKAEVDNTDVTYTANGELAATVADCALPAALSATAATAPTAPHHNRVLQAQLIYLIVSRPYLPYSRTHLAELQAWVQAKRKANVHLFN